jgi:cobalt-zinc-cadmium efflux system outer membrane protein
VDALGRALALTRRTRLAPLGIEVGVEREREPDGVDLTGPVLELRLPLFDTGKASVARLESELARARWQLAALEGQARSEVRERLAELAAGRELVALHREVLLPRRREVLQGTLLEHNQMVVGTFDVLVARQREIAAEAGAVEALADYWTAWYELERAVGVPLTDHTTGADGAGMEESR